MLDRLPPNFVRWTAIELAALLIVGTLVLVYGRLAPGVETAPEPGPVAWVPIPTATSVPPSSPTAPAIGLRVTPSPMRPTPTVTPTPAPPPPTPTPLHHTVQPGETLSLIAERYGVTVDALVAANNLRDRNTVHVDQELIIPSPPSSDAMPGAPAATGPRRYTVVAGDTLGSIAQRHGVAISAILRANNLTDPDAIKIGQELIIPSP